MSLCDMMWQPIGVHRATSIVSALLSSLADLHDRGELHGHLHPELIQLHTDARGREIAELLPVEALVCSLDQAERASIYRAPEQLLGSAVTAAADLHAVGVILYEMLTGQPPWRRDDPVARVEEQLEEPLPPLPPHAYALEPLLHDLTAKDPQHRCGSAREALRRLHLVSAASSPPPSTPALVAPPPSEPHPAPVARVHEESAALLVGGRRRWVAPVALLSIAALVGMAWVSRTETPVVGQQGEILPASVARPAPGPVNVTDATVEPPSASPRVEEELPPPPNDASRSRLRRRGAREAPVPPPEPMEPSPAPLAEAPTAEPEVQVPEEPPASAPPRARREPARTPGASMSADEAEAWSRTRGGVPLQSYRKRTPR